MSGSISVSPFGLMPSFCLTCAFGAAEFCAVAEGDEHAAAPTAAARAMSNVGLIMIGSASWAQRADVSAPRFCHRDTAPGRKRFSPLYRPGAVPQLVFLCAPASSAILLRHPA